MVEEKNRTVVALGRGREQELTGKEHEGDFWGDGNVLYLEKGMGACICQRSAKCTLKMCVFNCIKFYLKKYHKQMLTLVNDSHAKV